MAAERHGANGLAAPRNRTGAAPDRPARAPGSAASARGVRRSGAALLIGACAVALAACSGSGSDTGSPARSASGAAGAAPSVSRAASAATLSAVAEPALDLVGRYRPAGYLGGPVASGYDWAAHTGEEIAETLPGPHLFQIACSGSGHLTVRARGGTKDVVCGGGAVAVPFRGKLDALVDGAAGDSGVYAWRVLSGGRRSP
ncbi:hypothetical protein AB0399_11185 [Streptomyces sp. NPDC088194]|uniref:hypothetical protein n=1 Tax=Streptomyces sp. NPDC088194 TaxID=3154931 RepID=UPI00344E4F6C